MLIKDIQDVKKLINTSAATTFTALSQHISNAEIAYIRPLIGADLYDRLEQYAADGMNFKVSGPDFTAAKPDDADHTDEDHATAILLYYLQHAIIHMAYFVGFDMLNAYVSDGGFKRSESASVKSLFKYQEDHLKQYFKTTGFNSIDTALEWLEANATHFPEFGDRLSELKGRIIPNTKAFDRHYNINASRLVFMRLSQHIKMVEEIELAPVLGKENVDFILAELAKAEPAAKVKAILPYLRDPVAYLSVAMLMEESGADLTDRGLYYTGQRSISNSDYVMPATDNRIAVLVNRNRQIALRYLDRLKTYLLQNSELWNDYESPRDRLHERDNTNKKTFWV